MGCYIKINTDYGGPYQVNFNQDYLLMGEAVGGLGQTHDPLLCHVTKKTISGVNRHPPH